MDTEREAECLNCKKSLDNGGTCEDLNCADYPCPSQDPEDTTLDAIIAAGKYLNNIPVPMHGRRVWNPLTGEFEKIKCSKRAKISGAP